MLMGMGAGEAGEAGEEVLLLPNAQFPIPNYEISIFSLFFFLKGTRTKL